MSVTPDSTRLLEIHPDAIYVRNSISERIRGAGIILGAPLSFMILLTAWMAAEEGRENPYLIPFVLEFFIWPLLFLFGLALFSYYRTRHPLVINVPSGAVMKNGTHLADIEELERVRVRSNPMRWRNLVATVEVGGRAPVALFSGPASEVIPAASSLAQRLGIEVETEPLEANLVSNTRFDLIMTWLGVFIFGGIGITMMLASEDRATFFYGVAFSLTALFYLRIAVYLLQPEHERPAYMFDALTLYATAALLLGFAVYGFVDDFSDLIKLIDDPSIETALATVDQLYPVLALIVGIWMLRLAWHRHKSSGLVSLS